MSNIKVFKKGETLQKEGEKATVIYLIQSGSVSLQLHRSKVSIELAVLGGNQIIGEHALSGLLTHPHSAVALAETKAIELPVEALKLQLEQTSQVIKFFAKAATDKLKLFSTELRSLKLERDATPCPADQTAKAFATVFHVATVKGVVSPEGVTVVNWQLMKQYAQRMFLESPKRLQNAVNIFVKLGVAKYEFAKPEDDPDGPDEISAVQFSDLILIEQFFEFYQYYYFKGGKLELLKTDERVISMVEILLEIAAGETLDRHGAVRIDYTKVVDKFKELAGYQLNTDHFTNLETKGLLVKRQSSETGVFLHFDVREFDRTLKVWRVLREVERWNEKGSVDPNEPVVSTRKTQKGGLQCPDCKSPYEGAPKFCSECGCKFTAAAAA